MEVSPRDVLIKSFKKVALRFRLLGPFCHTVLLKEQLRDTNLAFQNLTDVIASREESFRCSKKLINSTSLLFFLLNCHAKSFMDFVYKM